MKRFLFSAFVVAIATGALADDWRDKAVAAIKTEKKVIDALFSAPQSLWVSVRDDGSSRDGFAQYLCLVVNEQDRPLRSSITISIWDASAMARQQMKKLGQANCEKS